MSLRNEAQDTSPCTKIGNRCVEKMSCTSCRGLCNSLYLSYGPAVARVFTSSQNTALQGGGKV